MHIDPTIQHKIHDFFTTYPELHFSKGAVITFAHEEPQHILYLTEGTIGQYTISNAGNKIFVNIFKPRAFFPMSWAINRTPNSYFFEALTTGVAHKADPDRSVQFVRENPDVLFDLMSRVYRGTDSLLRRLAVSESGSAANRLILELIVSCYRFGEVSKNNEYTLTIHQSELAERTGLARETVTRELGALKSLGLVTVSKGSIVVHNLKNLEDKILY